MGLAGIGWWMVQLKPPVVKPAKLAPARTNKHAVTVRNDMDWSKVSDEELRGFYDAFGGVKSPRSFEMDVVVAPGESILAEVYEGAPGEYVFTKLTPAVKTLPDGTRRIEITLDSFSVSVSGNHQRLLSHLTAERPPRGSNTVVCLRENGYYDIEIDTALLEEPLSIRLKATGKYENWTKSDLEVMKRQLKP
jgi:hypothetical protein